MDSVWKSLRIFWLLFACLASQAASQSEICPDPQTGQLPSSLDLTDQFFDMSGFQSDLAQASNDRVILRFENVVNLERIAGALLPVHLEVAIKDGESYVPKSLGQNRLLGLNGQINLKNQQETVLEFSLINSETNNVLNIGDLDLTAGNDPHLALKLNFYDIDMGIVRNCEQCSQHTPLVDTSACNVCSCGGARIRLGVDTSAQFGFLTDDNNGLNTQVCAQVDGTSREFWATAGTRNGGTNNPDLTTLTDDQKQKAIELNWVLDPVAGQQLAQVEVEYAIVGGSSNFGRNVVFNGFALPVFCTQASLLCNIEQDGTFDVVSPLAPVIDPSNPASKRAFYFISEWSSLFVPPPEVTINNLGGFCGKDAIQGGIGGAPNCGSGLGAPPQIIRIVNAGSFSFIDSNQNLVVQLVTVEISVVEGTYIPNNATRNGIVGENLQINMAANNPVKFEFRVLDENRDPITYPVDLIDENGDPTAELQLTMKFFDIDLGVPKTNPCTICERLPTEDCTVCSCKGARDLITVDSDNIAFKFGDGICKQEDGPDIHFFADVGTTEGGANNPLTPYLGENGEDADIVDFQKSVTVDITYKDTNSAQFVYEIVGGGFGRNLLLNGFLGIALCNQTAFAERIAAGG